MNTPAPFSEGQGQLFYPGSEDTGLAAFSRSGNVEGGGDGGGSAQNPPQKKKVRKLIEKNLLIVGFENNFLIL